MNLHKLTFSLVINMELKFLFVIFLVFCCADAKKLPKCSICKDIVRNFHKGLGSTAKSNFGGGNTKWEEKSLGSYAFSETRLVEIIENLCEESAKECHSLLEEHEETIERFWFKEFGKKKDTNFHQYLCIDHMMACCPNNTYGRLCKSCPGGEKNPCSGNGECNGAGTREGTGKCKCSTGYKGDLCNECKDGFYEGSENDKLECKACHISCKNTCWEGGPKGCDECKSGWTENEELGCQDINECLESPCEENQYCTNTQGSHSCFTCDLACLSCEGSGPARCTECNAGYKLNSEAGICADINECSDGSLCTGDNQECENLPGSYECVCKKGFSMSEGSCQPIPEDSSASGENSGDQEGNTTEDSTADSEKDEL